jgi:flagellar biosynthesis protein FlhA
MQICNAYKDENSALQVLTLHPELEQMMEASVQKTERGPRLILRPDMVGKLFDATTPEYEKLLGLNETPVLVTSPGVRFPLKKMLESSFPNLVILSYSEISGGVNIKSVGTITIQEMSP